MAAIVPRVIEVLSVPVSDQDRSKAFYTEVLGFEVVMDTSFGDDMRWVMLRPPGGATSITLTTWFATMVPGSLKGLVIGVDDIESSAVGLRESGALRDEDEISSASWGRFVTIFDPDGNELVIQQDVS